MIKYGHKKSATNDGRNENLVRIFFKFYHFNQISHGFLHNVRIPVS